MLRYIADICNAGPKWLDVLYLGIRLDSGPLLCSSNSFQEGNIFEKQLAVVWAITAE